LRFSLFGNDLWRERELKISQRHFKGFARPGNDLRDREIIDLARTVFGFEREGDLHIVADHFRGEDAVFSAAKLHAGFVVVGQRQFAKVVRNHIIGRRDGG